MARRIPAPGVSYEAGIDHLRERLALTIIHRVYKSCHSVVAGGTPGGDEGV